MKTLSSFMSTRQYAIRIFFFLLAAIAIAAFFPKEGKFKYEFKQGMPWMHENLIAPFSFPIYKNEIELKNEKDSIRANVKPHFRYNEIKTRQIKDETMQAVAEKLQRAAEKYSSDPYLSDAIKNYSNILTNTLFDYLGELLAIGIIPENVADFSGNGTGAIVIVRQDIAENYLSSEILTAKQASFKLLTLIKQIPQPSGIPIDFFITFFESFSIDSYIVENLDYDKFLTDTKNKIELENISLSFGMVSEGEKIINRGEIITPDKYNILESFKKVYETQMGLSYNFFLLLGGQLMIALLSLTVLFLFILLYRREVLKSLRQTSFVLLMIVLFVAIASLTIRFKSIHLYFIPFALLPIIVRTFYDSRLAIFIHFTTILLIGFIAPNGFEFVYIQFVAGVVAIFSMQNARKRSQLFWSAFYVFLTYSVISIALSLLHEGNLNSIKWFSFIWLLGNAVLLLSVYPLIYLFEKLFGFLSDLTLLELADTNNPLLRDLAAKAPGTFQHSLQVANLAEEAIYNIGGNPLLIRTGALYHDIGKLSNPAYFIENQQGDFNPHDTISFERSADIIISHVTEGVKMARKANLPEPIIDFIRMHHGTTRVQYFYKSFLKQFPHEEADINRFTYPGPIPDSKETAVLMMADSVEAASRSMKQYSEQSISELVNGIISFQQNEGQFNEADITMKEISKVKEIFVHKLRNIYHHRIEYPK